MKAQLKEYDTDDRDVINQYNDMLDETTESNWLTETYGASRILEEVDPIAYNCGLSDFLDTLPKIWLCDACGEEYETEEEAEECCEE